MAYQKYSQVDKLHTEVLKKRYGKIHAVVYRHNSRLRISGLLDEKGVSRTHALVLFPSWTDAKKFKKIDSKIRKGGLLGETFKSEEYEIRKNVIDVLIVKLPAWLKERFKSKEGKAKVRISEFYVKKKKQKALIYGIVIEIYSPDFRPAVVRRIDRLSINPTTKSLNRAGINKEQIWKNIKTNNWKGKTEEFKLAQKYSHRDLERLRNKLNEYLRKKRL